MRLIANLLMPLAFLIVKVTAGAWWVRLLAGPPLYLVGALVVALAPVLCMLWFLPLGILNMVTGKAGEDTRVKRAADPMVANLVATITLTALYQIDALLSGPELVLDEEPPPD